MCRSLANKFSQPLLGQLFSYTRNKNSYLIKLVSLNVFAAAFEIVAVAFIAAFISKMPGSNTEADEKIGFFIEVLNYLSVTLGIYDFQITSVLCIVIALFMREFSSYFSIILTRKGMSQVEYNMRTRLAQATLDTDYLASEKIGSGPIVEMSGMAPVESAKLLGSVSQFIRVLLTLMVYIGALAHTYPELLIIATAIAFIVYFSMSIVLRRVRKIANVITSRALDFSQKAERIYSLRRSLKIDSLGEIEISSAREIATKIYELSVESEKWSAGMRSILFVTLSIVLFSFVLFAVKNSLLNTTILAAWIVVLMRLTPILLGLNRVRTVLAANGPRFAVANDTIQHFEKNAEIEAGEERLAQLPDCVRFKDVVFSYPGVEVPSLKKINCEIHAGELTGVVGHSGAGKSSLFDLLTRLIKPSGGQILLDNIPINTIKLSLYRGLFCYVGQQPAIFDGSLHFNMDPRGEITDLSEINKMLEAANLSEFVNNLPGGLQTIVGERGQKISGGQKQRIAVIAALLKKAKICLFDEPTSGLDFNNEQAILQLIKQQTRREQAITLIISHNWSLISKLDRMLVLDKGGLVFDGKPDQNVFFEKLPSHALTLTHNG